MPFRLEVQEKRLHAEIDAFEHEKEQRRKQEEEEFSKKMMEQDQEFQKIIRKIDVDRKTFAVRNPFFKFKIFIFLGRKTFKTNGSM